MILDSWFNWKAENAGFNSVGKKSAEKRIEKINKYGVKTQVECFVDSLAFHTKKNEYLLRINSRIALCVSFQRLDVLLNCAKK